jgi:hypothetical protein
MKRWTLFCWLLPLIGHSPEALAWGLATHLYFAQLLLWAVPLADPKLRRAVRRLPRLLLAGACLPDLALVAGRGSGDCFRTSHDWAQAQQLLDHAGDEEERALAVGYCCHLFVDVIAHNHFVPAHEAMWLKVPVLTHALAEWVMDAHVGRQLFASPPQLMQEEAQRLIPFVARHFGCKPATAGILLRRLTRATRLLYGSGLHRGLRGAARLLDRHLIRRCDHYVAQTTDRLSQINRLFAGEAPRWRADLPCPEHTAYLSALSGERLRGLLPLPGNLFG